METERQATTTGDGHPAGCRCPPCWAQYMRDYRRKRGLTVGRPQPYFADATENVPAMRLTRLGRQILDTAARRENRAPRDIVERLLRDHASDPLEFADAQSTQ